MLNTIKTNTRSSLKAGSERLGPGYITRDLASSSPYRLCSRLLPLQEQRPIGVCFGESGGTLGSGAPNSSEFRHGRKNEEDLNSPMGDVRALSKSLGRFVAYPTRRVPLLRNTVKTTLPNQFILVHINKTKNNTHCVVSTMLGEKKTLWSMSGGRVSKIASGRRKSRYVQRMIFQATINKLLGLDVKYVVLHCKGTIISKRYILKTFNSRIRVILFKDMTNIAHNGTRPTSRRRV
jgi:ribosomal protein S11